MGAGLRAAGLLSGAAAGVESVDFELVPGGAGADSGTAVDEVDASAPVFAGCVAPGACSPVVVSLGAVAGGEPALDAVVLLDGGVAAGTAAVSGLGAAEGGGVG